MQLLFAVKEVHAELMHAARHRPTLQSISQLLDRHLR
jgi:hypothetical protein